MHSDRHETRYLEAAFYYNVGIFINNNFIQCEYHLNNCPSQYSLGPSKP